MRFKLLVGGFFLMSILNILSTMFAQEKPASSIYELKMTSLDGQTIDFQQYKGKKLLIVNTASKCGYTYQYEDLQKLHEQYSDRVTILGFPANNFMWQEPGTNNEIAAFCQKNYGVTFQMFEKISVKGRNAHPLYKWLKQKTGKAPSWNFSKYFVDERGETIVFFGPNTKPLDAEIVNLIVK
jgi:glutathione peroxidase